MSWGMSTGAADALAPLAGPVLSELETDLLALQQVELSSGDRLKLFPQAWPADQLPPPSSSLLSIASQRGLLAAAGPDSLVIATTDNVRSSYIPRRRTKKEDPQLAQDEPKLKPLNAQVTLPIPRVSHVAFSADGKFLVIAAEQGGGLAVYDVDALIQGGKDSAFQISTNGTSIRHLLPNPALSSDLAHCFAIVLSNGQLLLADLRSQSIVNSSSGSPVFQEKVTCAAWSKLGKQIIAGLQDGSCAQIDGQGVTKDRIPRPPQLDSIAQDAHQGAEEMLITSISWLSTHQFLLIFTPIYPPPGDDMFNHDSTYFFAQREKGKPFTFRHSPADPSGPFGLPRKPAYHFVARLNNWQPNLEDALIVTSTASTDVGLFTSFKPQNEFVMTIVKDESRRATLPISAVDDSSDTSAVGVAFDLSAVELAPRPIPAESDVIEQSPGPLPALCVLNTDGVLSMWWVVYSESIRQKTPYPGIIHQNGPFKSYKDYAPAISDESNKSTAFGQPATAAPSLFGSVSEKPSTTPVFGSSTAIGSGSIFGATSSPQAQQPAFGTPSTPAFGTSSLGPQKSVWGTPSASSSFANAGTSSAVAFGKPSFASPPSVTGKAAPAFGQPSFAGASSAGGSAFGQVGGLGVNKGSPWGTQTFGSGQASTNQTPASSASAQPSGGNQSFGFSSFAGNQNSSASPFATAAKAAQTSVFGSGTGVQASSPSPFSAFTASKGTSSPFAKAEDAQPTNVFATPERSSKPSLFSSTSGVSPFAAASSNNAPWATKSAQNVTPTLEQQTSMGSTATLGSTGTSWSFGAPSVFANSSKPALSKEPTMENEPGKSTGTFGQSGVFGSGSGSGSGSQFGLGSGGFKLTSSFKGDGTAKDDLPKPDNTGGNMFGDFLKSVEDKPPQKEDTSVIKTEPGTEQDEPSLHNVPEVAPKAHSSLPPKPPPAVDSATPSEPVSRQAEVVEDAPLPPDFLAPKKEEQIDDAPLPPDFLPPLDRSGKAAAEKDASEAGKSVLAPIPDDAPLPPDFLPAKSEPKSKVEVPLAGSPPVDLGKEKFPTLPAADEQTGPDEADWEDDNEPDFKPDFDDEAPDFDHEAPEDEDELEGEEEDDEGEEDEEDEEDEDEVEEDEEEEDEETQEISNPALLNAFKQRITPASPKAAAQPPDESTTPPTLPKPKSFTPAGRPFGLATGPKFPPPSERPQLSPRSPSPVRAVTNPVGHAGSLTAQGLPPGIKAIGIPPAIPAQKPKVVPKTRAPENEPLRESDAHTRIVEFLESPVVPSKALLTMYTKTDVPEDPNKIDVRSQIEKVYRDLHSMIDLVGLNARVLETFVQGHEKLWKEGERSKDDLEDTSSWAIGEINRLAAVADDISQQLEEGKLEDVASKVTLLKEDDANVLRLKAKTIEIRKQLALYTDPDRRTQLEYASLPVELKIQQTELRHGAQRVQKLLSEVERKMGLLRADIASASAANADISASTASATPVPTVEAVTRTILKMTAMIEQKSGDIDVLEAQINKLPGAFAALRLASSTTDIDGEDDDDDLAARLAQASFSTSTSYSPSSSTLLTAGGPKVSATGSPIAASTSAVLSSRHAAARTPLRTRPRTAFNGDRLGMSAMFGLADSTSSSRFQTPPPATPDPSSSALMRLSTTSFSSSANTRRRALLDVPDNEIRDFRSRTARRAVVLDTLRRRVLDQKGGPRVVRVEERV